MKLSISRKVSLLLTVCLMVIFAAFTWFNLVVQRRAVMRTLQMSGIQVAGLVAGATRNGMLENNRDLIQTTIDSLARIRDVSRIRIIEKGGRIAYSTTHDEIGRVLDPQTGPCVGCHGHVQPPYQIPPSHQARLIERTGRRLLGITQVIQNQPNCSTAACHVHTPGERLLGTLYVDLDLTPYDETLVEIGSQMIVAGMLAILLIVTLTFVAMQKMVRKPVRKLIEEARLIAAGDLSARVPEFSGDELGALAHQFNIMARDLEAARAELLEWGMTLEERAKEKTKELRQAQAQILQVEKMASLGRLAAVVAHEINNPLASVVTYARLIIRKLKKQKEPLDESCRENLKYLETIASEAERCGEIVAQLLSFARRRGGEFGPVDVNHVVDKVLFLVNHKLELASVEKVCNLAPDLPQIVADENQMLQALMALLINAAQAMGDGGQVIVTTRAAGDEVVIEVADTGPGMKPEVAAHAFEPFFTTKQQGEGVGLGLSLVYGIVERHGGRIDLDTAPGQGCRFTLHFPVGGPEKKEGEEA